MKDKNSKIPLPKAVFYDDADPKHHKIKESWSKYLHNQNPEIIDWFQWKGLSPNDSHLDLEKARKAFLKAKEQPVKHKPLPVNTRVKLHDKKDQVFKIEDFDADFDHWIYFINGEWRTQNEFTIETSEYFILNMEERKQLDKFLRGVSNIKNEPNP